jgi:hypothetical protein
MSGNEVDKTMGAKAAAELQRALEGWREEVFPEGSSGYLKDPSTQKIDAKQEK